MPEMEPVPYDGGMNATPVFPFFGSSSPCLIAFLILAGGFVDDPLQADPVALADSYTVQEDGLLVVGDGRGVLENDVEDGSAITAVLQSDVSSGVLQLSDDGSFNYLPGPDFSGVDSVLFVSVKAASARAVSLVAESVFAPAFDLSSVGSGLGMRVVPLAIR